MSFTARSGYADQTIEGAGAIGDTAQSNPVLMGYKDGSGNLQAITAVSGGVAVAGAANWATSQVTTSGTAGTLAIARATRRSVTIKNTDPSITVYVGPATVTAGNGMPLKAGESMSVDWTGLIQVIAASGTPVVAIADTYD